MMFDIFSSFDDQNGVSITFSFLVWFVACYLVVSLVSFNRFFSVVHFMSVFSSVVYDLNIRSRSFMVGGSSSVFGSVIVLIVLLNLFGLIPFVFSLTSHLAVNLSLAFPLWLGVVLMGLFYDLPAFLSHLQPMGAPALLNPFLCLIELVSLLIRPVTLAVRLTANLSTGHILMALLGGGFSYVSWVVFLGLFYMLFEMAVCVIQSYIFTLLPTLYADEHPYY